MPNVQPTLPQLAAQVRADIESRLAGADARLRRNNLDVEASVLANTVDGLYSVIQFLSLQMFIQTATGIYLEYLCALQKVFRKLPAAAFGAAAAVGTDPTLIGGGILLSRADQVLFITTTDVVVDDSAATLQLAAVLAGSAGNTAPGTQLTIVNGIGGVSPTVTVGAGGLSDGTDIETDDELRARGLEAWQQQPQGGAKWDYTARALTVPGVTRAWVFPAWMGLGTVGVSFVMDDQVASIFPDNAAVAEVLAVLTDSAWEPVVSDPIVFPPTNAPCAVSVHLSPDTPALRTAVTAALQAMFFAHQSVAGAFLPPDGLQTAGIIPYGYFWSAVEGAIGEGEAEVVEPTADFICTPGQLPTLGVVSFV
jgi:uncharacterized phage protein gp47/JayE